MVSYISNYIKNYIYQILATGIGLLSLFVVVPYISGEKMLYGIYSICVSLTIFVNYADLGFLNVGQKYAAESYAKGNYEEERIYLGFTLFVLLVFVSFVLLCFIPIAIKPSILIPELDHQSASIVSSLIWIIILFSPVLALKRILFLVYAIRIEHYKYQKVTFVANIIKILSVFYFFKFQNYNLIGYYLFIHVVELISAFFLFRYASKRYDYALKLFIKTVRFSKNVFDEVKSLANASLLNSVAWILFYELDFIILAKIASPNVVAVYSVAFTILTFFRNYLSIIYSVFSPRYNHFIGKNNTEGLRTFFMSNVIILTPFVLYPIVVYCFGCYSFIISWVGEEYMDSIPLSIILVSGNLLAFINYPSSALLTALNKVKTIILLSFCLPLIFYGGILFSYCYIGITSFAVFKTFALLLSSIYGFCISSHTLNISILEIGKGLVRNYALTLLICIVISCSVAIIMPAQHMMRSLVYDVLIMTGVIVSLFAVSALLSPDFKNQARLVVHQLIKRVSYG